MLASFSQSATPRRDPHACQCRRVFQDKSVHPVAREQASVAAQMALDVFGDDAPSILVGLRPAVNLTLNTAALFSPGPAVYNWRLLPAESEEAKQAATSSAFCRCLIR